MADTFDVFISHAGEDKETIAKEIYNRLEGRQIRAFLDKEEIRVGSAPPEMITAMETAPVGVFIWSPEFAAKEWPIKELECFLRRARQAGDGGDAAGSLSPTLIPVFYRMTVADCRDDNLFKKHRQVLQTTNLFERVDSGETNMKRILDALKELSARMGIKNEENANNEPTEAMKRQRMRLVQRVCSKVINAASRICAVARCMLDMLLHVPSEGSGRSGLHLFYSSSPPQSLSIGKLSSHYSAA